VAQSQICARSFEFAVRILHFCERLLSRGVIARQIAFQLSVADRLLPLCRYTMKTTESVLLALCTMTAIGAAAQITLPERVRQQAGQIETQVIREFSPGIELHDLVKDSDLIAEVTVMGGQSRLSKNQQSIETDYDVLVLNPLFSRQPTVRTGGKVVVTKPGGTVTIEGHQITTFEKDFPPFQTGEEYVLFLAFEQSTGHYAVRYGAQGAFRSAAGTIEQVSKSFGKWNEERGQVTLLDFRQELAAIIASGSLP
jgi:hypothetical protein